MYVCACGLRGCGKVEGLRALVSMPIVMRFECSHAVVAYWFSSRVPVYELIKLMYLACCMCVCVCVCVYTALGRSSWYHNIQVNYL